MHVIFFGEIIFALHAMRLINDFVLHYLRYYEMELH
jgi:hypothetical protein